MAEDHDDLCHCATVPEAVEAARKHYVTMAAADCQIYAFAFATALKAMATEALVETTKGRIDKKFLQNQSNQIGGRTRELVNIEELCLETAKRREYLRN